MADKLVFGIGLQTNKDSNDFLRCLWSRLSVTFGEYGWQYMPARAGNDIFVGFASFGDKLLLEVTLSYKKKGCLSKIEFVASKYKGVTPLKKELKRCVEEALNFEKHLKSSVYTAKLDKNLSFNKKKGKNFVVEGRKLSLRVYGYNQNDLESMFKMQLQQVCNFLTFDTLRYVTYSGTLMEEIREKHNFKTNLIDKETGEVTDTIEKNGVYRNLEVSDYMADYIDQYLDRPYMYEDHLTLFDISVQIFSQAIRNEELSRVMVGLPEPYVEMANTNYMSALEVITLNDKEPETCEHCGQKRFSIARRVRDLMGKVIPNGNDFANQFYDNRSKFVHTGSLMSSNNYTSCSIPLMSKISNSGMIMQLSRMDTWIKEAVKECIVWHERQRGETGTIKEVFPKK